MTAYEGHHKIPCRICDEYAAYSATNLNSNQVWLLCPEHMKTAFKDAVIGKPATLPSYEKYLKKTTPPKSTSPPTEALW